MKISSLFCLSLPLALSTIAPSTTHGATKETDAGTSTATLPALPEKVTSFGAATAENWLYVFGGHKGERHNYDVEMVSGSFHRLNLTDGRKWERLPDAPAGQGVPLVPHGNFIYRIGGMAARNKPGDKQDLYSTALIQRFDIQQGRWEDFRALPESRSSHDAVVMGTELYIGGGWQLTGGTNKPVWPDYALVLDLARPRDQWTKIPQPFQRRALALAPMDKRLFFIGGMNSDNQSTLAVEVYDTETKVWSRGPELPPGKHKGFSCSAINQNGRIYASTFQGDLLRLASDSGSWEVVGRLQYPRLSHRIVAAGRTQILALGGEDGEDKRPELELLTPATRIAKGPEINTKGGSND